MNKKDVAKALEEIATLMELSGENPFKTRSYTNGARTIESLDEDLETLVKEKRLRELKGVGEALEQKIEELVTTGKLRFLEDLRAQFPPSLFELLEIPGLGPKRIKQLHDDLGIDSLEKLEAACQGDDLAKIKGFGPKMVAKLLEGIAFVRDHTGQHLCSESLRAAEALLAWLKEHAPVDAIEVAGSLRRRKEVTKDLDLVASSASPRKVMDAFTTAPGVARIVNHGDTKSSVILDDGIAADLRVVTAEQYPYALLHFTGSKEHNVVLRQRAKERKLKLNEYGLFRDEDEKLIVCKDETAIYKALDLPYIAPELREDRGECEAEELPRLVEQDDLLGVIHCHTTYSDGRDSLEDMVQAAEDLGYRYILITDHSQSAAYAGGLKPDRVLKQQEAIDKLQKSHPKIRIFKGIESDIRSDGALDYEEDVLKTFDAIVVSVHNKLDMDEKEATARTIKAIENPCTTILGHPTGRLLLARQGFPLNFEKIFDACVANKVAVEINANPRRLDIDWRHIKAGRDKGVVFSIGPDAHRVEGFKDVRFGLGIARKGWLEASQVLNCLDAKEFAAWRK